MVTMSVFYCMFFFFNDTATTEIYTLSLHDALPIWSPSPRSARRPRSMPSRRPSRRRWRDDHERLRQADLRAVLARARGLVARRGRRARGRPAEAPPGAVCPQGRARAARSLRVRHRPPLLAPVAHELRRRHALLPARLVHDEVPPEAQRGHGPPAGLRPP